MVLSLAIAFSLFAIAGIVIQQTGLMIVDVQDGDGRVFLPIPMLLVNGALSFASISDKITVPHELKQNSDIMQAAADELMRCPDGPFVEVNTRDDQILISKKGSNMIIDVKSDDQKMYVQIPIHATGKTLAKLASLDVDHRSETLATFASSLASVESEPNAESERKFHVVRQNELRLDVRQESGLLQWKPHTEEEIGPQIGVAFKIVIFGVEMKDRRAASCPHLKSIIGSNGVLKIEVKRR